MRVLYVSSGNSKKGISSIVKAQGDSLEILDTRIDYFTIVGHGLLGYLKNVPRLRKVLKLGKYDLVHAHFSLSGIVATLAGAQPIVVSLMGWNVQKPLLKNTIKVFNKLFWNACIVKSVRMKDDLRIEGIHVIPNGVNLDLFKPIDQQVARKHLGWNPNKKHFLCAADPARQIKNTNLAQAAYDLIRKDNYELHFLGGIAFEDVAYYYNASDVVFLTSKAEGSPNVIKEALACNCKVVSTDVGDVRERFLNNPACFITKHEAHDIAVKLENALRFEDNPRTRELVIDLDSNLIAEKIYSIYQKVIINHKDQLN